MSNNIEQTGREQALEQEVAGLRNFIGRMSDDAAGDSVHIEHLNDEIAELKAKLAESKPTMPVIPKAVAIAIFREGMEYGAKNVCDELSGETIEVEQYLNADGFDITFHDDIYLSDKLDFDWLRDKAFVGATNEDWVVQCLNTLCADNKFECRIHGIDDQEQKNND